MALWFEGLTSGTGAGADSGLVHNVTGAGNFPKIAFCLHNSVCALKIAEMLPVWKRDTIQFVGLVYEPIKKKLRDS